MTAKRLWRHCFLIFISLALTSASAMAAMAAASPAAAATARTASAGAQLRVTPLKRPGLVAAFAAARHIPAGDVAGVSPGTLHITFVASTKTYWATASFLPTPRAKASVLLKFQDGGSAGVFTRREHTPWRMVGSASQPAGCSVAVPRTVRRAWGLASGPNSSGWSNWVSLGGATAGDPSPLYDPASGHLEIYVRGTKRALYQKYWSPSAGWSGWVSLGGSIASSPAALYDPATGHLEVYAAGSAGVLYQIAWNPSSGWSNWVSLGGSLTGP
jgi:hypothetical protein